MSLKNYCEETGRAYILREWDAEKNLPLTPETVAHSSMAPVWWKCEKGHSWCTQVRSRSRSSTGCPKCREEKLQAKRQRYILSDSAYAAGQTDPPVQDDPDLRQNRA